MNEDDLKNQNVYFKIKEIANRSFFIQSLNSTDNLEKTSNWVLAGTIYAEFTCIISLRELKEVYPSMILKIFIGSLSMSVVWGIAYLIVMHLKRIEENCLNETLDSNKHHEDAFRSHERIIKGFEGKSGEEWKQHHVSVALLDVFQNVWFFCIQVFFFLIAFFSIIIGSFIYLN